MILSKALEYEVKGKPSLRYGPIKIYLKDRTRLMEFTACYGAFFLKQDLFVFAHRLLLGLS